MDRKKCNFLWFREREAYDANGQPRSPATVSAQPTNFDFRTPDTTTARRARSPITPVPQWTSINRQTKHITSLFNIDDNASNAIQSDQISGFQDDHPPQKLRKTADAFQSDQTGDFHHDHPPQQLQKTANAIQSDQIGDFHDNHPSQQLQKMVHKSSAGIAKVNTPKLNTRKDGDSKKKTKSKPYMPSQGSAVNDRTLSGRIGSTTRKPKRKAGGQAKARMAPEDRSEEPRVTKDYMHYGGIGEKGREPKGHISSINGRLRPRTRNEDRRMITAQAENGDSDRGNDKEKEGRA
jgi:hypothetical protein